jgi:hypothetical protein
MSTASGQLRWKGELSCLWRSRRGVRSRGEAEVRVEHLDGGSAVYRFESAIVGCLAGAAGESADRDNKSAVCVMSFGDSRSRSKYSTPMAMYGSCTRCQRPAAGSGPGCRTAGDDNVGAARGRVQRDGRRLLFSMLGRWRTGSGSSSRGNLACWPMPPTGRPVPGSSRWAVIPERRGA